MTKLDNTKVQNDQIDLMVKNNKNLLYKEDEYGKIPIYL
jgi:hypothetical protein